MKQAYISILLLMSLSSFSQLKWTNVHAIPKQWVLLNRDSLGYLIYKPCDGSTPRINIKSGYITVYWKLDEPDKFLIDTFSVGSDKKSFYIHGIKDNCKVNFNVKVVDDKKKLVLWIFDFDCNNEGGMTEKWLMTANKFSKEFRLVDNPCDSIKIVEKSFLPIKF